ncbi:MAG TPA: serine hydrolase [Allosphingosinicella sp.]
MNRLLLALAALLGLVSPAAPAAAQQPSPELARRAAELVPFFRGEGDPAALFSPRFLAAVPRPQLDAVTAQIRSAHGAVRRLVRIEPRSVAAGVVLLEFERATLRFNMTLEPAAPHRIDGLLLAGTELPGDSFSAIVEELRRLPGAVSFAAARLAEAPVMLAEHDAERPLAIGSAFKLFILAELDRSIRSGERRWTDVVRAERRAPSGPLQYWPRAAPVTLHTLASLMISLSDNSATDNLLHVVGRERVEALMPTLGVRAPERNRPFLSTLEAFLLKTAQDELLQSWLRGNEAERRGILAGRLATLGIDDIDGARIGAAPAQIDTIEWFASAGDLVRTMDWLRRNGSDESRDILAINPGLGRTVAGEFAYLGYKGGSEPGVINMTFLVRNRAGIWHAVAGSWNNSAAAVEDARFLALMTRALQLVR